MDHYFPFPQRSKAIRDYEMQSNKVALSPCNARCLLYNTKVSVQLCRNTGYNLNAAWRHLHVKGESMLPGSGPAVRSHEGRNQNTRNYAHVILVFDSWTWTKPPADPRPNINPRANIWKLGLVHRNGWINACNFRRREVRRPLKLDNEQCRGKIEENHSSS